MSMEDLSSWYDAVLQAAEREREVAEEEIAKVRK